MDSFILELFNAMKYAECENCKFTLETFENSKHELLSEPVNVEFKY